MPCRHTPVLAKRRVFGIESYVYQCGKCGKKIGPSVATSALTPGQLAGVRLWNPWLRGRGRGTARRRAYSDYLGSTQWKKLRQLILARDGYQCMMCGEEATEVHHLTYYRFRHERETDLISVCRDCNQHERERSVFHRMMGTVDS